MPRPRWESGMPLEMPRGRGHYSAIRGPDEMPAGVSDPKTIAALVVGDERRGHLIRRMAPRLVTAGIVTVSGAPVPDEEMRDRARLFEDIRGDDRRAAADAAAELWETRRAWILPGEEGAR